MYPFNIIKQDDQVYRLELDGINMLIDGYSIHDDKHWFNDTHKAIAFFSIEDNLYGVSNEPSNFTTAEEFYDNMLPQYLICKSGGAKKDKKKVNHQTIDLNTSENQTMQADNRKRSA